MESNNQVKSKLKVKKLDSKAKLPQKVNSGLDIYALENCVVPAHGNLLVRTGLIFQLESGFFTTLTSKLGLAWEKFITVEAGSNDKNDNNDEVRVLLFNHSEEEFQLNAGDPVATIIVQQVTETEVEEIIDNGLSEAVENESSNQLNKRRQENQVEDPEASSNKLYSKEFLLPAQDTTTVEVKLDTVQHDQQNIQDNKIQEAQVEAVENVVEQAVEKAVEKAEETINEQKQNTNNGMDLEQ